ncbi:hypothetical protein [Cryptosporangium aurantiacum]|uniref:hypothetical protein n=1 Tax=Cryptosporangium aurantiacum TaxID=134849 RepID=UPI0011611593|nr:hypothetical protein [Cryptosporangium aurantiacum]
MPLVLGLSLVPTVQRFLVVHYDVPAAVAVGSEILVAGVRVLLVVLVVRLLARELTGEHGLGGRAALRRLSTAIDARRGAFWFQWIVLGAAFVVCDVLPNAAVAAWVPDGARDVVTATMVAVKNPTVIAFTVLWIVGIGRTLIVEQTDADEIAAAPDEPAGRR